MPPEHIAFPLKTLSSVAVNRRRAHQDLIGHCDNAEMTMKILIYVLVCGALGLVVTSNQLAAQTASGADARLRERNITLPPVPSPVANYVILCV